MSDDRLISGSSDETLKIWNLKTKNCIASINAHSNCINSLTVLRNGEVVSGSSDCSMKIWK